MGELRVRWHDLESHCGGALGKRFDGREVLV